MTQFQVLNSRAPRVDAPAKATGQALYADDLSMPGMLWGAILHSPVAHARILHIDTSKALKLPGVKAIVTAKEAGLVKYGVSPARYDETLYAYEKVRYVGDEIAAVAAVDQATAQAALDLIKVDYEELPAVFDMFEAMKEGAPQIHDEFPGNLSAEVHQEFGDTDAVFATADLVIGNTLLNKRQDAAFIEPHACIAIYDLQGRVSLHTSTQVPHYVQRTVAMVLQVPVGNVRVVKPYVGGGFGPKAEATPFEMSAVLLARQTGKPVKIVASREEVFLHSRARHQFYAEMSLALKNDGTMLAVKNKAILDGGGYTSFGIATIYYSGSLLGGPYKLQAMKYDGYRVYTNKPCCGAQRGHGGVIHRACFEQLLDMAAEKLGIDPIELRLKNMMKRGDTTVNELNMSSLGMEECIEAVRDSSGWNEKKGRLPKGKGIGAACGFFVSGAGYPIYRSDTYHATVVIKISEDGGTATVLTASAEIGQGSDTAFSMIAAETLGIPLDDVRIVSGDTNLGVDLGAYSSRQTLMTGHATKEAAENVRDQIAAVLAEEMGCEASAITFRDGKVLFYEGPGNFDHIRKMYMKEHRGWTDPPHGDYLTFREAARFVYLKKGTLVGTGKYKPPALGGSYKGAAVGTSPAYGCSAQVVEVSVDMETGQVTVDKMHDAHDCGLAINRTQVEGQMQGSLSMGLGECLFEEVKFDSRGRVLNPSLGEYKIPTALDMPDIKAVIVESNEPNGPYGAKEVGEGAIMPTIPAILNAIYDATGVRVKELPCSSERMFMQLKEKEKEKAE
jgi:4-hydroxybenzoyl-CoA reductase alpha subunit